MVNVRQLMAEVSATGRDDHQFEIVMTESMPVELSDAPPVAESRFGTYPMVSKIDDKFVMPKLW